MHDKEHLEQIAAFEDTTEKEFLVKILKELKRQTPVLKSINLLLIVTVFLLLAIISRGLL